MAKDDKVTEKLKQDNDVPQSEAVPTSQNLLSSFRSQLQWPSVGHVVKTIILGIASNFFDVYSDVGSGIYHQQPKNVSRTFLANDAVPNNCNAMNNSTREVDHTHVCLEEDVVWATITFGCIQLPAVVLALCGAVGVVLRCRE